MLLPPQNRVLRLSKVSPAIFLLGVFLWFACFCGSGQAAAKETTSIYRVAIDREYAPYEFVDFDGGIKGFTPGLLREIGRAAGVTFEFIPMDWPSAVAALEKGHIDLVSMIRTPQRLADFEFSAPHSQIKQAIFRHVSAAGIRDLESLSGFRVALQRNDISHEILAERSDFERILVQGKAEGFLLLNAGKVDAFLAAEQAGLRLIEEYDLSQVEPAAVGLFPQEFCFAARKGNRALIALLNAGMQRLKESDRYAAVSAQWFARQAPGSNWLIRHWPEVAGFVAALALILIGFVGWALILRRRVEQRTRALRESRNSLAEAQRIAHLGNWELDLVTNVLTWSEEVYRIFEVDPLEFAPTYESFLGTVHPEDRQLVSRAYNASVEDRAPWDIVHRLLMPDGRIKHVNEKCETYYAQDGKPLRSVGTVQDVTERVRDGEALQRLNRELRAISDCTLALMRADDEQELLAEICRIVCEKAGYRMAWAGYPQDDPARTIRPVAWAGLEEGYLEQAGITWGDTDRGQGPSGQAVRRGESVCIQDFSSDPQAAPWRAAALARGYRSSIALPLKDDNAETFGILNIYSSEIDAFTPSEIRLLEELTADMAFGIMSLRARLERKQAVGEIARLNERLSLATRAARLGVWDWDMRKNKLVWDDRMYALYGVERANFEGAYEAWLQGLHPDDRAKSDAVSQQARRGEREYDTEFRVVWPDGSIRWLKAYGQVVRDAKGNPMRMIGVNFDITAHKQAEAEIHALNQQLEQRVVERTAQLQAANQELEAFCYSVSHDLRAPLRHINGYVELLVARCQASLDEKGVHYADTIAAATHQMGELIDDLLQFSRTGRTELRRKNIDMNSVLQEALTPLQKECSARAVAWEIATLPQVSGDFALLRQVWANLLENALKYTRTRETARIAVNSWEEDGEIVFRVTDNGVGFDTQYAGKLFGVFQRLHPQDLFEGTGIGLATVQRIIARHGGRVWAEAEPDRGARFYFTLPTNRETRQD